jgi:hypothetical protein
MEILKYNISQQRTVEITGVSHLDSIPDTIGGMAVTEIAAEAFSGGTLSGTEISLPDTITEIGAWAFDDGRFKRINIPKKVTVINNGVFHRCTELEEIIIPRGITRIGISAFEACLSLKSILIPNTVVTIDRLAFASCMSLESIRIPESVISIGDECFQCIENKLEIIGQANSYAEKYAAGNNIRFMINNIPDKTIIANPKHAFFEKDSGLYLCRHDKGAFLHHLSCCNSCDPDTTGVTLCGDWKQAVL